MSRLSEAMRDSLVIRRYVPAELVGRYDELTIMAQKHAAAEDAREAVAAVREAGALADIVELHGDSRGMGVDRGGYALNDVKLVALDNPRGLR